MRWREWLYYFLLTCFGACVASDLSLLLAGAGAQMKWPDVAHWMWPLGGATVIFGILTIGMILWRAVRPDDETSAPTATASSQGIAIAGGTRHTVNIHNYGGQAPEPTTQEGDPAAEAETDASIAEFRARLTPQDWAVLGIIQLRRSTVGALTALFSRRMSLEERAWIPRHPRMWMSPDDVVAVCVHLERLGLVLYFNIFGCPLRLATPSPETIIDPYGPEWRALFPPRKHYIRNIGILVASGELLLCEVESLPELRGEGMVEGRKQDILGRCEEWHNTVAWNLAPWPQQQRSFARMQDWTLRPYTTESIADTLNIGPRVSYLRTFYQKLQELGVD